MKYAVVILAAAATVAVGQDRVTVPLTDASRPATVRVDTMRGDLVVRAHEAREVVVESRGGNERRPTRRDRERDSSENQGLKRIDIGGSDLNISERDNVVTVHSGGHRGGDVNVLVPRASNLTLKTMTGEITVEGVRGDIEANSMNGEVTIRAVEGSVVAHSLNGDVSVVLDRVETKPMSFSTMNGDIDVTLPADVKARFKLHNDRGEIYSDFDMKLERVPPQETQGEGMKKVRFERTAYANINGGGPEVSFRTVNGEIRIRQKK
jgi:hypothetical protein